MLLRTAARACTRIAAPFLASGALMLGLAHATAAGDIAPEYAVRAAYLSKFGLFVSWHRPASPARASAVVVCVAGDNPFGDVLDKAAEGQRIAERPIVVRYPRTVTRDSGCDILYVHASEIQSPADILSAVNGAGVLTVTDSARSDDAKGIIDFVVQNNRVRFTIDEQAAAQNGITISSHLLNLALSVKPRN